MSKHGYFVDAEGVPVRFRRIKVEHLEGKPLEGILGWLFWWIKVPQYRLLEPVTYVDPQGVPWIVPAGFIFNGGSIPFLFWWLCAPDQPDSFAAFALHDWLCTPPYPCSSRKAHWLLYHASRANGYLPPRAFGNYLAVRALWPRFTRSAKS